MRILLVNLPWAAVEVPSLALGVLRSCLRKRMPEAEVEVVHANLEFLDWAADNLGFSLDDYQYFARRTYISGCGEWVFSAALYNDPEWRLREFHDYFRDKMTEAEIASSVELHRLVPGFIRDLAERIVAAEPDYVGFTSAFQQNTAALATAGHLKRLAGGIRTVMGGANCNGVQGAVIHRNFPVLDFVVRGEGEIAFPRLIAAGATGDGLADIDGLCWRAADGRSIANPMGEAPLPPSELVAPDFSGYFERFAASKAADRITPRLIVEGSRGCWWGEKHHCLFCGLNGVSAEFRSKHPDVFYEEMVSLAARHRVLDVFVVDNILDLGYLTSLLPRLAGSGYDLRLEYAIKSNLTGPQVQVLADAGLDTVQVGIENLSDRVLSLMSKGATGCQNVRVLRDGETSGITMKWSYLCGFPGERDADYQPVVDQMPALHHLPPPSTVGEIVIERFSPYFDRSELGFTGLRPTRQYEMIYDLPASELADLAYLFGVSTLGISPSMMARLRAAVGAWREAYPTSHLTHHDLGNEVLLLNQRKHDEWDRMRLTTPMEIGAFRRLERPVTAKALAAHLAVGSSAVAALLRTWRGLGIVFTDGERFVHVVPRAMNQHLLKANVSERAGSAR
ncbi:MAG: RiPP maturation radical SAM protein 1 [Dactylosporangium sp.]|nr:RiPP maturation radical SAM C-methyltransferase [Dactylosporangium sp.]NNJ61853.1 RiPP maturation radical SAM protein 1 [Dactylosporangium sp.]